MILQVLLHSDSTLIPVFERIFQEKDIPGVGMAASIVPEWEE
jgi:hypothetical protein